MFEEQAKIWSNNWKKLQDKYIEMNKFKYNFFYRKFKYYFDKNDKDKKKLLNQLQALNDALVWYRKYFNLFFTDTCIESKYWDDYIFKSFLTNAYKFISDIEYFWEIFKKVYDVEKISKEYQIKINFKTDLENFQTIKFLRNCLEHQTNIILRNNIKKILEKSKYLTLEGNFAKETNLYLHSICISLDKNPDHTGWRFIHRRFIHNGEPTGIFSFNNYKNKIIFNTHQIINDFMMLLDYYLDCCIKIEKILCKERKKYLVTKKAIKINAKNRDKTLMKTKVYDFNLKNSKFYKPDLPDFWNLEIERKIKWVNNRDNPRVEFVLTYQHMNDKPRKDRSYGIKGKHKGCSVGKLMNDLLGECDRLVLRNLAEINPYSIEQPDFLLIAIFLVLMQVDEKYIVSKYLNRSWFMACGVSDSSKKLEELEFPWHYITRNMPFDERIKDNDYLTHLHLTSYSYEN